jgi:molybdopterin converting factor small subunit
MTATMCLAVRDATGQQEFDAEVPSDATWGEVLPELIESLDLPDRGPDDQTIWAGRVDCDGGRYLHASEVVGDVLADQDEVVLMPEVTAG